MTPFEFRQWVQNTKARASVNTPHPFVIRPEKMLKIIAHVEAMMKETK